jgi:DNA-binding GntR family transcriptional regulator
MTKSRAASAAGSWGSLAQETLAERVVEALADEIVSGRLAPGQRVDLAHYATKWHVSITPVRDAIKQLESNGFLVVLPRRGVFVTELTAKEVKDIFDVRIALESVAIRLATPRIPAEDSARALDLYVTARDTAGRQRARLLPKIDLLIHSLALKYCDNTRLQKTIENMTDLVKWCQNTIILNVDEPFVATLPEHIAICEAVCARDPERAAKAMHIHLTNTSERIQEFLAARERSGTASGRREAVALRRR